MLNNQIHKTNNIVVSNDLYDIMALFYLTIYQPSKNRPCCMLINKIERVKERLPYRLEHSPRRLLILGGPKLGFYLEQATIRE